ncbi:pectate lyase [Dactylosporangium sp. NPDC048998]|uniref:pectate lyase n=1 Tax=Dactylosporangium sp. NPDC048998 TaxID=3363976 RepID=UPI003720F46B
MRSSPTRRRVRLALAAASGAAVVAGVTLVAATSASAATVDTGATYVIVNRNSGKVIDVYNWAANDGAPINQWTRNDQTVQQWKFVDAGSGYYKIKSVMSGKVLELPNAVDGTQLVQNADSGATTQHFRLQDSSGGYVRFVNRHSNKVLDVWNWSTADGAMIAGYQNLDGANQQWQLVKLGSSGGGSTPTAGTPTAATPTGSWPTATGSVSVSATIKVSGTLDGGLKRYCCIGDGSQSESQPAMFELADGATIKNVIIGSPAGDGVHCLGRCTIQNVWWEDVGEDAATFLATNGDSYVIGGGARSASDKVFQHNGSGTVHISGFYAKTIGKLYRACGNCTNSYQRHVTVDNVLLDSAKYVVGINTNWGDTATLTRVTLVNSSSAHVCAEYKGVAKGSEPTYLGDGMGDGYCNFKSSDITYR